MVFSSALRKLAGPCVRSGVRRGDRSGAVAAEFALILPLLTLFLMGTIQLGFLVYTYNSMLTGARNGARQIAFGTSVAQATTSVRQWLPPWAASAATVTITENDGGLARVRISVPGASASIGRLVPMPAEFVAEAAIPRVADR